MNFDVFNGDADGICALHQLRLAHPAQAQLVTGVKRDIELLARVRASIGDHITVLDVSLAKNRDALIPLLKLGALVDYFDHHIPGEIPDFPNLRATIDTSSEVCTSLLVDRHLQGKFTIWAVVAAFGDNLHQAAQLAARPLQLNTEQLQALRELGECINYNAYGESVDDLYFHPEALYDLLHRHADPFIFMHEEPAFAILKNGYAEDMQRACAQRAEFSGEWGEVYVLPEAKWSRRVSGVYGNHLATSAPSRAHAVLTQARQGVYVVSVRAPLTRKSGADALCRRFGGGGRQGAAGIDHLPEIRLPEFIEQFNQAFSQP